MSLDSVELVLAIEEEFGIDIPTAMLKRCTWSAMCTNG
jgi:acyl carrier protein